MSSICLRKRFIHLQNVNLGNISHKITKAVFPVAGFGTRFLPATKTLPKELLPIVDKPLIQYAAEEAISAGVDTLIFITGWNKRAIEDHFDNNQELEMVLRVKGKNDQADMVENICQMVWNVFLYAKQNSWYWVMRFSLPSVL